MIQPNKGFRRPEDFVNAANELSQPMAIGVSENVLPTLGITPPAPAPAAAPEAQAVTPPPAAEATVEPDTAQVDQPAAAAEAPAPAPAATPEKPRPTPKAKQKPAEPAKPKAPWDDASDKLMTGINWRHSEQLHKKMEWVKDNVPKHNSLQKIIDKAVEDYVAALIEKHYKPEDD